MAKDQGVKTPAKPPAGRMARTAPAKAAPVVLAAKPVASAPKPRVSPIQFWREVQAEGRKVTWTPWRETWITSVLVAVMIVITALFFSVVDGSLNFLMQQFLRFANGG
jgi:preprotein translocase subunit SecE